jgi:hypothetical protein
MWFFGGTAAVGGEESVGGPDEIKERDSGRISLCDYESSGSTAPFLCRDSNA